MSSAPRTRKAEIGDQSLIFCYDANAILELEQQLGLDGLNQLSERFGENQPLSIGSIIKLVWCGLLRYQPEISQRDVGALIDASNMADLMGLATDLMVGSGVDVQREVARDQEVRIAEHPLPIPDSLEPISEPTPSTTSDSQRPSLVGPPSAS